MNNRTAGRVLIIVGLLFFVNAIFGRYLILPSYLANLEKGSPTSLAVSAWGFLVYMVWAYSFKLGVFLTMLGAFLHTSVEKRRFRWLVVAGLAYLVMAYLPIPGPYSIFFGIGGVTITILILLTIYQWQMLRKPLAETATASEDLRLIGYFFFAMATYNLCGLMGISAFALRPEKMIQYGLQPRAASFASHVMTELVSGWLFTYLSYFWARRERRDGA